MIARLTWRRVGLLLQSASLAAVGIMSAVLGLIAIGSDGADDPHGCGRLFGSIFLLALSTIGIIGALGLLIWWRSGRDTPLIAYDVFVCLVASQFLQPVFEVVTDTPTSNFVDCSSGRVVGLHRRDHRGCPCGLPQSSRDRRGARGESRFLTNAHHTSARH